MHFKASMEHRFPLWHDFSMLPFYYKIRIFFLYIHTVMPFPSGYEVYAQS